MSAIFTYFDPIFLGWICALLIWSLLTQKRK